MNKNEGICEASPRDKRDNRFICFPDIFQRGHCHEKEGFWGISRLGTPISQTKLALSPSLAHKREPNKMSSILRGIKELRDMRKEMKQSIADGTFGRFSDDDDNDAMAVPSALDLRTESTNPFIQLVMPGYERTLREAPHDWTSDPLITSSDPVAYEPLSAADCQIRVLTLLTAEESGGGEGNASAPIRCSLETVSLLAPAVEDYTALSYMWGGIEGETRTIAVDGRLFQATPNLHAALRQLRNRGYRRLWIDAVCINQADREERSQQVLQMRSIYARAAKTVVWLGPESGTSNLAMHLLNVLSEPGEFGMGQKRCYREAVKGRYLPEVREVAGDDEQQQQTTMGAPSNGLDEGLYADAWLAFDELFDREYWRRMWIIQEITVSREIDIMCGFEIISWKKLEMAFWGAPDKRLNPLFDPTIGVDFSRPPRRTGEMFDFWGWRKAIAGGQPKALLKAMLDCGSSKATDPRDHIYALLGITMDGSILVPVPNYALPVAEVFTSLATSMIEASGNIDLICLQPRSGKKKTAGLPSWVPDWADLADVDRPYAHDMALQPGDKLHDPNIQLFNTISEGGYRILTKNGILSCSGRLYDIIDGLSGTLTADGKPMDGEDMGIVQPDNPTTCYPGVLATAEAIQQSLHQLLDWTREVAGRDCADVLSSCWLEDRGLPLLLKTKHRALGRWLEANRDFVVGSVELGRWLDMHHGGYKGLINRVRTQSRTAARQQLFEKRADRWMGEAEEVLKSGMRLMTTARGRVGMAHPQARKGDHICFMEGMDTFVILRPYEGTAEEKVNREAMERELRSQRYNKGLTAETRFSEGYQVVGEAYVKTLVDNKTGVEDYSACTFFTFFIH
ncbi:hypothetical protein MCOR25_007394 [Pyricularia grisea]|nr:hypothetical protein MCOR25_007394 [Pyricularia grisea]